MTTLLLAMIVVLACHLAAKRLLAHVLGSNGVSLGPFGTLHVVTGRLWLPRQCRWLSPSTLLAVWAAAALILAVASNWVPASGIFVGMLLGGALSNAMELLERGYVSDYVCLRFWPSFNLADVALVVGAVGTLATLVIAVLEKAS